MKIHGQSLKTLEPFHVGDTGNLPAWLKQNEPRLRECLHTQGMVLIRGSGVDSSARLQLFATTLSPQLASYTDGNSPRTKVAAGIYTSTEYAADAYISLHNELSYCASWPEVLYFCCVLPSTTQGHTLLADSREILRRIDKDVRDLFIEKGVKYIRNLHDGSGVLGKSWQQTFETEDRSAVEAYCVENSIEFEWLAEGLRLVQIQPATRKHPVTHEEVWFNQADQFHPTTNEAEVYEALMELFPDPHDLPHYACFADDTEIDLAALENVRAAAAASVVVFDWQKGDVLMIDNMLCAHGRSPYTGDRKILVAMA